MEFGVVPASRKRTHSSLDYVFERQVRHGVPSIKPAFVIPDEVNCAVIRYHSRRVTCLEFHPTNNNILLSDDKKGQLGVWDFGKVHEKTVFGNIHQALLNNMKIQKEEAVIIAWDNMQNAKVEHQSGNWRCVW
ncbi:hypothetical protein SSX86_001865 [Deinandra increscens subsp. villosa]|uniref:Uncharacterized protein n=1 Tax=Deinandra increscens subsp. villosa TaxID=3103831 RepID=A0AAP0HEV7_9ASTR